jgi:hypothetical protein
MRKITADIQNAIRTNTTFKGANTEITWYGGIGEVRLHGHLIALQSVSGWRFCFQGYRTNTTRDRINAVRGALGLPLVSLTQFRDAGALLSWFN